ncbi:MAG TPA: ribose 5-phosphate isomerase A [Nitrososphaera sp.]|jgi:ribose 5-phosphate isomerase A
MPSIQDAFQRLAKDAVKHARRVRLVGLGSGSSVTFIVRELSALPNKDSIQFIPTSLQIKIEAERANLRISDEAMIPDIDLVFDGADQIDSKFNMIKGGGGALLREKILISAAKKVVIVADESKFVKSLTRSVPIEVHPMARTVVARTLTRIGAEVKLRTLDKGYPFVTENGNLILDATLPSLSDPEKKEIELKRIPGVMEVGLFTRRADILYKAKKEGSFEVVST